MVRDRNGKCVPFNSWVLIVGVFLPVLMLLVCIGVGQNYSKLLFTKKQEANFDRKNSSGARIRTKESLRKPNSRKERNNSKFS